MARRPRSKSILENDRIARADGGIGQSISRGIVTAQAWLTAIDQIGAGLTARILQGLRDDKRQSLS